jgi:hypothetical protein
MFFQIVFHFDDSFNPTSSPSPPFDCRVDNGIDHVDNFSFLEEDNEHLEDENQRQENMPSTPMENEQLEHKKIDQEQHLKRSFCERKRPDKYGYDLIHFNYSSFVLHHIHSETTSVSFFIHAILYDPNKIMKLLGYLNVMLP